MAQSTEMGSALGVESIDMVDRARQPTSGAFASLAWLILGVAVIGLTIADQRDLSFPTREPTPTAMIALDEAVPAAVGGGMIPTVGALRRHSALPRAGARQPRTTSTDQPMPSTPGPISETIPPAPFEQFAAATPAEATPFQAGAATNQEASTGFSPIGFSGGSGGGGGGGFQPGEQPVTPPVVTPPVVAPPVVTPPVVTPPVVTPPVVAPPVVTPPVITPPS